MKNAAIKFTAMAILLVMQCGCERAMTSAIGVAQWIEGAYWYEGEQCVVVRGEEYRKRDPLNLDDPSLVYLRKWVSVWTRAGAGQTWVKKKHFDLNVSKKYVAVGYLPAPPTVVFAEISGSDIFITARSSDSGMNAEWPNNARVLKAPVEVAATSRLGALLSCGNGTFRLDTVHRIIEKKESVSFDHLISCDEHPGVGLLVAHGTPFPKVENLDILTPDSRKTLFSFDKEESVLSVFFLGDAPFSLSWQKVVDKAQFEIKNKFKSIVYSWEMPVAWADKIVIANSSRKSENAVIISLYPLVRSSDPAVEIFESVRSFWIEQVGSETKVREMSVK